MAWRREALGPSLRWDDTALWREWRIERQVLSPNTQIHRHPTVLGRATRG
jgi:hypothetical protein